MKKGWEIKKLGEIGKVSMCKRILKEQTLPVGDIPFYKIGTFGKVPDAFISRKIYEEFVSKYPFPKKGDILISASGTIGRCVIYDGKPAYFQDSNIVWIDNNETQVLNTYLNLFYSYCDWKPSKGATISRLYNDDLRSISIPIPPLPEQQHIVSILDEAFGLIEKAKLKIVKNLQNAKELFQSELNSIFSNKGEGWEEKALGEVCETISDGDHQPPPKTEQGIPFITISNINKESNQIDFSHTYNVSAEYFENIKPNRKPQKGDVLYTVTGSYGIPVLIDFEKDFCFQRHIGLIRPSNKLDTHFLFYWILSPNCFRQAHDSATGTAQKTVSLNSLRSFKISVPNLETQQTIVQQLDKLSQETKRLEAMYQQKLDNLEELKKSILQKAFSGELKMENGKLKMKFNLSIENGK